MRAIAFALIAALLSGWPGTLSAQPAAAAPPPPTVAEPTQPSPVDEDAENARLRQRVQSLEEQLQALTARLDQDELEKLRQEARTEAAQAEPAEEQLKDRSFVVASRSLQMLNPEITLSGDVLGTLIFNEDFYTSDEDRSTLGIRALDMHIQSSLDPFSQTKLALGYDPAGGVSLEELYITWSGLLPKLSLTVGRFRQLLGVLNRWHRHDLDQTDYPLALTTLLGPEGLAQTGVSLSWLMPALFATTNELTLQITNGANEALFVGEFFSVPSTLLHLKNFYDVSASTYLELGLSGMFGFNNRRGVPDPDGSGELSNEDWRTTYLAGLDLTLHWQPPQQGLYRSLTWRSEGFYVDRQTPEGRERGWGAYSYLQYQLSQRWFGGLRGDVVQPLALDWETDPVWQVAPYVTFWQSEFVYLRLELRHGDNFSYGRDTRLLVQLNWAAGPHKHEKY